MATHEAEHARTGFPPTRFAALGLVLLLLFAAAELNARYRFEEGDWIAWGDTRLVSDICVGRNYVYLATGAGIQRWDRHKRKWMSPWFSVPGTMDRGYLLTDARKVLEDPLSLDLYVQCRKGWFHRDTGTGRWEPVDPPSGTVKERLNSAIPNKAEPGHSLITPHNYRITPERNLEYRYLRWPFAIGAYDPYGLYFYAWEGYGTGIAGEYNSVLDLYPGGPGPATALFVSNEEVWAANELNRRDGWLWRRKRNEEKWSYFHPDLVWGLEPGKVNRIRGGSGGIIWLATSEGVMIRQGSSWKHLRRQEGLPRRFVHDLAPVGRKAWAVTDDGIALLDAGSFAVLRPDDDLQSILRHQSFQRACSDGDTVWIAGPGRLYRKNPNRDWKPIDGPSRIALATEPTALYARNGVFAIGDRMGFAWRDSTGQWREIFANRWKDGVVRCIAYHGGFFWLGTDRGLAKFDPREGDVLLYTHKEGLAGESVHEIFPEGDWLWLGTNRALVRFKWYVKGRLD